MKRFRTFLMTAMSLLILTAAAPENRANAAEHKSVKEQLVGSWSLVSLVVNQGDKKVELFGPNPRGLTIFAADGRFMQFNTRASLPRFAGANRMQGTLEEYKAIGQGAAALSGTYEVDEPNKIIAFRIEVSTYPNWEGEVQKRLYTLVGDELHYINPMTSVGPGNVSVTWKRVN